MEKDKKFVDMNIWQDAHKLALLIYKTTQKFPEYERFALANQLRRAASSIPSNVAEGFNRLSLKEKIQFYSISHGSTAEVQSHMLLAKDLGYIDQAICTSVEQLSELVHKQLTGLIKSLKDKTNP